MTQPKVLREKEKKEEEVEEEEDRESGIGSTLDLCGSAGNFSADRLSNALSRCEAGGQPDREGTAVPIGAASPAGHNHD